MNIDKITKVKLNKDGSVYNTNLGSISKYSSYASIIDEWVNSGGDIEPYKTIDELKVEKVAELNYSCGKEITSGFESSALGSLHKYQSELEDQTNLIGLVTSATDDVFKAGNLDVDGNVTSWEYKNHTIAQLKQVLLDGKSMKQAALAKYYALKEQVGSIDMDAVQEDGVTPLYASVDDAILDIESIVW